MQHVRFPFITQLNHLISVLLSFNQSISFYNKLIQLHMTIVDQYRGKAILITGTTGFLGKVLLQKFLFSLPDVEVIYVLIRRKKGLDLNERFKKQVISSACFDRIRNKYGNNFDEFIEKKIKPIEGDLQKQKVGLSPKDLELVINTCNIIINCAASIDFNQRLDGAIESNIKGSLRMQSLAKSIKNLDIFTHVSTCYVNCNMTGLINEQIYESKNDPQDDLKELLSYPVKQLVANTKKILGKYPNTYTFTKALCERLMEKRRGDLPMCIVRPAIINSSYQQPFPGWLDSIAAAAAMYLFVGLGIIKEVKGNPNSIGDTIPVDVVVANIIVATAFNLRKNGMPIYHVGSSDRNPITWGKAQQVVTDFWNSNPSISRVGKAGVVFSQNQRTLQIQQLKRRLPVWMYSKVAPFMGKQHLKNAQKMIKTLQRGTDIKKVFQFFTTNEWIYESKKVKFLNDYMTPDERKIFMVDAADIDVDYFLVINNYGLQKYILKENVELPSQQNYNLLRLQSEGKYFSDINWAWNSKIENMVKPVNSENIKTKILSSSRVLSVIEAEAQKMVDKKASSLDEEKKILSKEAIRIVNDIVGEIKMPVIRFMAWCLHKIFRKIYEKVNINNEALKKLKEIQQEQNIPVVFMPTHKSYIDFLIVSYILFVYQQKLPYIVSDEALLKASVIPFLIRSSGAFFYKKKEYKNSTLYKIIFDKYVELLLREGNNMEFFIEGTRSRTGKILKPQCELLNIIFDTVYNDKVSDVLLVPLTINYEKVLEGDTFPSQLLGEQKVAESLLRVIKAYPLLKVNFGRVYVELCDPISVKSYMDGIGRKNLEVPAKRKQAVATLAKQIIYKMTDRLVILSTGIVSCVLLMNRKGITEDNLIKSVNWIAKYILKKGYRIGGINENSSAIAVRNAITYLEEITTKTKKNIFELQISAGQDFQKILMLSYYRNTIVHTFLPEAFVSCALAAFGAQLSTKQGVKIGRLYEETVFLTNLLSEEYLIPYNLQDLQTFKLCVRKMQENGILLSKSDDHEKILINLKSQKLIILHFSLIRSLLQCYWATLIYLISILKNEEGILQVSSYDKFYDMVQWQVESMYEEKVIMHYEACSLQSIQNALSTFAQMKFIKFTEAATKKREITIEITAKEQDLESFGEKILFFLKNSYQISMSSPLQLAKNTKGAELSKL